MAYSDTTLRGRNPKNFNGAQVRQVRETAELSQIAFGRVIGISSNTIWQIERKPERPVTNQIQKALLRWRSKVQSEQPWVLKVIGDPDKDGEIISAPTLKPIARVKLEKPIRTTRESEKLPAVVSSQSEIVTVYDVEGTQVTFRDQRPGMARKKARWYLDKYVREILGAEDT